MNVYYVDDSKFVRCPCCAGQGKILVGERDPIEGSKMQGTEKCPFCVGAGMFLTTEIAGKALLAYYKVLEDERKANETRQRALSKLTDEEKEVLGLDTGAFNGC